METSKVHIRAYLTDSQLIVFNITFSNHLFGNPYTLDMFVPAELLKPLALIAFLKQTLSEVLDLFLEHPDASYLPVLDQADDGRLLGVLNQNNVLTSFRRI